MQESTALLIAVWKFSNTFGEAGWRQDFFGIGDAHDLELHVPEQDREESVVLPGDDDGAFVNWGADFETDAIVRKEYELGGVPYLQHLRVIVV